MEFQDQKAIYLQIADFIEEAILTDKWQERLPAIRELAAELKVNPNTVTRTYAHLEAQSIISMQRGIGYFVAPDAKAKILASRKEAFLNQTVPQLFKMMDLLDLSPQEILALYKKNKPC